MYVRSNGNRSASILMGAGGLLLLVSGVFVGAYFVRVQDAQARDTPKSGPDAPSAVASAHIEGISLDDKIELVFEKRSVVRSWSELGAVKESGGIALDRGKASEALLDLKGELDRRPLNARMDLENRTIHEAQPGWGVDVHASVSALESAARVGTDTIELEGAEIPPTTTAEDLGIVDVSTVLGHYVTKFSIAERSRNDNLKLLASHMDGLVIQPGEEISFNDISGDRTEKEGYKVAHVITAGELVDGMAGGACQISTTLHAAAFFAGLDVTKTTPHSRPSTYIELGLDSTVVYPHVDLKLKNPYDFPVAIRYRVARGEAEVEILGKEKPFDKVEFIREVIEKKEFETVTREDDTIGFGHMVIDQPGYPGYKMHRYRKIYKDGKVVRTNKWVLNYRPVVEYVRMGVNPNPNLPAPEQKKGKNPALARGSIKRIVR